MQRKKQIQMLWSCDPLNRMNKRLDNKERQEPKEQVLSSKAPNDTQDGHFSLRLLVRYFDNNNL